MMRKCLKWMAVAVVACGMSACSSIAPPASPPSSAPIVQLQTLPERFTLTGRIGVKADGKGYYANFDWTHADGEDQVAILSPLGQTMALIQRSAQSVSLTADGKVYDAPDSETLTRDMLGWALPLDPLAWWVNGSPAPGEFVVTPQGFSQQGWEIASEGALPTPMGIRPSRLHLQRPQLDIRMVIHRWQ